MTSPTKIVEISRHRLQGTVRELARRGEGQRESGAFLLGRLGEKPPAGKPWPVAHVAYYDDLDAECLTGGITFRRFEDLWKLCRAKKMTVIGDLHTHPGSWVEQSVIDAENPMISTVGHVAIIIPNYAQFRPSADTFGVHVHLGGKKWASFDGPAGSPLRISPWAITLIHAIQNRARRRVSK